MKLADSDNDSGVDDDNVDDDEAADGRVDDTEGQEDRGRCEELFRILVERCHPQRVSKAFCWANFSGYFDMSH